MDTPIWDFIKNYAGKNPLRLHMPGHKGHGPLGCEIYDLTEINGADSLYEASGIIAKSEENAARLFGSGHTFYSAEGSSQCIKAMIYLALVCREKDAAPLILAARNAHKAFLQAAALTGTRVSWLLPEGGSGSLLSCPITPETLGKRLSELGEKPCAVYITSPDYLGNCQDIAALSGVCRRYGVPLLADNAHGAYLHFLKKPSHPVDLGAAMCSDSAHKTLPVLTGGAYLHISEEYGGRYASYARQALSLFGSSSPSYLVLASLDLCNSFLAEKDFGERLSDTAEKINKLRLLLRSNGWDISESDPLRITVMGDGASAAKKLGQACIEPEYTGPDALVMLINPENPDDFDKRISDALGKNGEGHSRKRAHYPPGIRKLPGEALSIREAMFLPQETIKAEMAAGRIAASPSVSCPPAVPVVMPGEIIGEEEAGILKYYGYNEICVVRE